MASEFDVLDWMVLGIFLAGFAISFCVVMSVQGDLLADDTKKIVNDNAHATSIFLGLVNQTRKSIIIHDDGNNSPGSVYNNEEVMESLRSRIRKHGIQIRCLFNDADEPLALLDLVREFPDNVDIWYLEGDRPEPDIHYKIVDGGKLVHLSKHAHGSDERVYVLRDANRWWVTKGARSRISKAFRTQFDHDLKFSKQAQAAAA